jgi:hypothetical protein
MDCTTGKGGKVKCGKNKDKKIVMVKLIIQEKKNLTRYRNNKKFSLLVKVLELKQEL